MKTYDNTARLASGGSTCAGCGIPLVFNPILQAVHDMGYVPVTNIASGCGVVGAHIYPHAGLKDPMVHVIFETAGAGATGVRGAIDIKESLGLIPEGYYFPVVFAGDGATTDIGIASLSGMLARGDEVLYVCYDNGFYANTGCQYSSQTPAGAHTTTTPQGFLPTTHYQGKDMIAFAVAHPAVRYIAHTTISTRFPEDIREKSRNAVACGGASYMHVIQPCPRGWGTPSDETVQIADVGIDTGVIPIYHIVRVGDDFVHDHLWYLDYVPERYEGGILHPEIHPVSEWFDAQGRFRASRKDLKWVANMQKAIDHKWLGKNGLINRCEPYGSQ